MPLRCLVFSSNEEMVQPIWQVLTELGIEGEYCRSAVDAVERVTTQLFQIVVTDWDDQPEAAFLLKTTRDLKAAYRPLNLAIVGEDSRLPEALQAGANSVLVKPIHAEQIKDTMSTASELLRSRQAPASALPVLSVDPPQFPPENAMAASAWGDADSSSLITQAPRGSEKAFRAGEFLQSPSAAPGGQFDTECEVQKSLDRAAASEVDALTELEPMASAVIADPTEAAEPPAPLTGWASLQERLIKSAPINVTEPSPRNAASSDTSTSNELLSFSETTPYTPSASAPVEGKSLVAKERAAEVGDEAALFAYMDGESKQQDKTVEVAGVKTGRILLCGLLATAIVVVAVPQTRYRLRIAYANGMRAGNNWLNPQPVVVPPASVQHENFGLDGDEYKFPASGNIPDATTDTAQIRVLPVVDPTAKPAKNSDENGAPGTDGTAADASSVDDRGDSATANGQASQAVENPIKEATSAGLGNSQAAEGAAMQPGITSPVQMQQKQPVEQAMKPAAPQHGSPVIASRAQVPPPPRAISTASTSAIPLSLRSTITSMTPEASGAKPIEAAMSSIEPVILTESAAWGMLTEPVDPVYPNSAKASGQRGSVKLEVLIGRDGTVQDAKFLQGSLIFARAAIDAVKQWHFKPYSLNGRAVSVQSAITLNFKPPA